jgi:hypothetical protein
MNETTLVKNKSFVVSTQSNLLEEEESKNDAKILQKDFSRPHNKDDYFSESDDYMCIVNDENEEAMNRPLI